jgi:hypothetical protein
VPYAPGSEISKNVHHAKRCKDKTSSGIADLYTRRGAETVKL